MIPRAHIKTQHVTPSSNAGSATFLALFMLALLSFIGVTVLMNASRLYNGNEKVQGWQEALRAAEAGADIALANLRWTVVSGSPTAFDPTASPSPGWQKSTTTDPNTGKTNNTIYTYTTPIINPLEGGEGTVQTWAVVTVDSPIGDNTTNPPAGLTDKNKNQWYRIRSTGHARLSGLARVSNDILSDPNARRSNALRKFSLRRIGLTGEDLTTGPTPGPQAIRTIEQIVKPKTGYNAALIARTSLSVTGNQTIDSYDSSNSFKSTNGLYDPAKRQGNGNVAVAVPSPGPVPSGALTIGSGEKVYGNAGTDAQIVGGTNFTDPNNTIQAPGTINNGFNIPLPPVPVPTWGTGGANPPINSSVTTVTSATTITVNSDPTQNYYKIANITAPLTIAPLPVGTTGTVNIWLTGTQSGNGTYSGGMKPGGAITIPKGVTLKVYVDNGVSFHPGQNGQNVGAIDNQNMDASTFLLYGVGTYPGGNAGAGIDLHVGGGSTIANFYGTVYAPYRYVLMKYDGNTNYDNLHGFYGSFVGNIMTVQGSFHYDEASAAGIVNDYVRASYVEDPR